MYNCVIIAAVLFFLPLRFGFSDAGVPLFDFSGTKSDFAGFDIDIAPDAAAALLLLVILAVAARSDRRFETPAKLTVPVFILSLLTTVQISGYAIYNAFPSSYGWAFNPTVISGTLFGLCEIIMFILVLITFGFIMDALISISADRQEHAAVLRGEKAITFFRRVCWSPVLFSIISSIVAHDAASDNAEMVITASSVLVAVRILYYLSMLLTGIAVVSFVVGVRPERRAATENKHEQHGG